MVARAIGTESSKYVVPVHVAVAVKVHDHLNANAAEVSA
jgi:hypothetical protein